MCERLEKWLNEFITQALDGTQKSVSRPDRFDLRKTAPLSIGQEAKWKYGRSESCEKK
jgi:hypothetical protein